MLIEVRNIFGERVVCSFDDDISGVRLLYTSVDDLFNWIHVHAFRATSTHAWHIGRRKVRPLSNLLRILRMTPCLFE